MTTLAVPITKNQGFEDGPQNINNKKSREVQQVEIKKRLEP